MNNYVNVIDSLLESDNPTICYKILVGVLSNNPRSDTIHSLQSEIKRSEVIQALLSERELDGTIPRPAYEKWQGAHWVLIMLAELNYPQGDTDLLPLREQVYDWIFSDEIQVK